MTNKTTAVEPFAPIAIIGQGCVLPGAHSPEQLWELVTQSRDMLGLPPENYWGVPLDRVATSPDKPSGDHTWSAKGGYVRDFDAIFDPGAFAIDEALITQLDPLFQWTLEAARQAWHDAGFVERAPQGRTGVILGNLSYPTRALSDFALEVWQQGSASQTHAYNRYMSGLPAQIVANALGARGEAFCLDAACASSLYAIKLASDRLHDGSADVMLVGGVNHADDLFLHIGFCALKAMSRTGQSRPFNQGADGLVPAEGAGFVVLKRLDDALRDGDVIQGVIRGVGLSNDGRGRGMLTPSQDGQWRAMTQAYEMSGLSPDDISLIECHATGTPLGDATELRSMATIFEGKRDIPIGSLKSNLGHLITASGVAGLLKVLSAMKHEQRPPTIHIDEPVTWLSETPFRLLEEVEPWECDGLRRAAINNFGFGGNNAHLLVEEWVEQSFHTPARSTKRDKIAIVGMSAMVANHEDVQALTRALLIEGATPGVAIQAMDEIEFDITKLRFPPNDLAHTLPQQLLALKTAMQLSEAIDALPIDSTGIYMGMQCDTEIARYGARWRMARVDESDEALEQDRAQIIQSLVAAGVLGTMPNIVANRMNSQFNLLGPSYTVSAEEASGITAMQLAMRALCHGELDAALVGAADLCHDPVHEAAARAVLPEAHHKGGDVGVILILKRLQDALDAEDTILATIDPATQHHSQIVQQALGHGEHATDLAARFGHAHAASGLLHVLAATLCCHHNVVLPDAHTPAVPNLAHEHRVEVRTMPLLGQTRTMTIERYPLQKPTALTTGKRLYLFSGDSIQGLESALKTRHTTHTSPFRVAILCEATQLDAHITETLEALNSLPYEHAEHPVTKLGESIWFGRGQQPGETAYVFTGPAGSYANMGRELLCAMPHLVDALRPQFANLNEAVGWIYEPGATSERPPEDKLWGSSFLSQVHAQLTRHTLGIPAQAAIGFCSGETNALFAMGAWHGLDAMHADIRERGVFDVALGQEFEVLESHAPGIDPPWQSWRVLERAETIREAIADEPRVHLTIISAPGDCVMAGEPEACARVIAKLGEHRCRELGYNIVMHCPEAKPFTESWHALHHRPTQEVPGVRFYTNASCSSYQADADKVADALTEQAMHTVDFPALIERAWQDGVRVFIEHGPQSGCSKWISKTLGDRPHVAVSLDAYGHRDLDHISATLAALFAAGITCDWSAWPALEQLDPEQAAKREVLKSFPAHLPDVQIDPSLDLLEPRSPARTATREPETAIAPPSPAVHEGERLPSPPVLPGVLHDPSTPHSWAHQPAPSYRLTSPHFTVTTREQPVKHDSSKPSPVSPSQRQPQRSSDPAPAQELRARPTTQPEGTTDVASISARHFEQLSALHKDFLARQTQLQQEFLNARARIFEQVARASQGQQPAITREHPGEQMPHSLEVAHSVAFTQDAPAGRDDVVLATPLFSTTAAAVTSGPTGPGTLPTSAPTSTPVQARATASASAPKTSMSNDSKILKDKGISARSTTDAPATMPQILPPKPVSAPQKKQGALKSAGKNLKRHVITPSHKKPEPIGPTFDAEQVAVHASGKISEIFGPEFSMQDDWRVQVRMPEPPLLLCHRVTGIDCPKGIVSTGTLWCESDIPEDAWYLHEGRMPVGIMIESGQADLMLISWMGADFENKGERVYRLLGCELMFHGGLAQPGDVLKYDIHIDAHARQDAIRLFFFHYDLEIDNEVRLSVRNGQAGFFSYEELAESNGILWTPADEDADEIAATPFDAHPRITPKRSFSQDEVQRFSEGGGYEVFGEGFEKIAAHTRTPRIQSDKMRFMDEVVEFDPNGGPWGRGYLKAVQHLSEDTWFFDGHFLNDPCMPGTLMFEGCVQVMAFYMAACGWTVERDGWIFEPVPFEAYPLRCRGQVTPGAQQVVYEVLVREVHDGDVPKLYADLMCTVDGLKAFHCGRMGLQLTPAWPMDRQPGLLADHTEPKPVAKSLEGHEFGYDSLLACAWGRPTRAFGQMYAPFDSHRTVARLPGPPYHFISRVTEVDPTAQNAMRSGVSITVEYDVPEQVWYFEENGAAVMPYAVLLEAALQPCGWLASYVGCALTRDDIDLAFRNLDGTTTQFIEVTPETGTLRTSTKLTNIARAAGNIIVSFLVEMRTVDTDELVLTMDTVFGFFPPESLANQVGLPIKEEHRAMIEAPHTLHCDLTTRPERYCAGGARLAEPMLLMLDRITAAEHEGGSQGLGFWRGEKDVDPNEWFFKAHFFQDPVQPGSLGLEALLQLLQFAMLDKNLDEGFDNPRFEAIAIDEAISWKYRGQVLTHNKKISSTLELQRVERDERGVLAIGEGSLWVDGMRIYHSKNVGMRIVEAPSATIETDDYVLEQISDASHAQDGEVTPKKPEGVSEVAEFEFTLDPKGEDGWLLDHCPTHTAPALPMMSIVDLLVQQANKAHVDQVVSGLRDVSLKRWVIFPNAEARELRTRYLPDSQEVTLELWWDAPRQELSRYDEVARATVEFSPQWPDTAPEAFEPLRHALGVDNPYQSGELFHGPAFQLLRKLKRSEKGASSIIKLGQNGVPEGAVQPGVLDAALQSVPHDHIETWWHAHEGDTIGYPHGVEFMRFYGPTPTSGDLRCEVRFISGEDRKVTLEMQVFDAAGELWMMTRYQEILFPKGRLGRLNGQDRRAFIRDRQFVEGAHLSDLNAEQTTLSVQDVLESNWFKGTLESLYVVQGSPTELAEQIAVKEHIAAKLEVHPEKLRVDTERGRVFFAGAPLLSVAYTSSFDESTQTFNVSLAHHHEGEALLETDMALISQWWQQRLGVPRGWLGDDLYRGMIERFVSKVSFEQIEAMDKIEGRSVFFLGNHEVQIESLLITILGSVLADSTVITMANAKHEQGWVGQLIRDLFAYPGCEDPENIVYFDQKDQASMFGLIEHFKQQVSERGASVMVHAPGTRARSAGEQVERVSSALIDMALELGLVIVPVNFSGGLPNEQVSEDKLEFPVGQTGQHYRFGKPLLPEALAALPYAERRRAVLDAINRIAPAQPAPNAPVPGFEQEIDLLREDMGLDEINATLLHVLMRQQFPGHDASELLTKWERPEEFDARDEAHRQWLVHMMRRFFASRG